MKYRHDPDQVRVPTRFAAAARTVLAAFALLAGIAFAGGQPAAQQALPDNFRAALDAAAAYVRHGHSLETRVANSLNNRPLYGRYQRQSRSRADAQMASTVVELIERRPDLARTIVDYAGRVAPETRQYVTYSAATAFPALGITGAASPATAAVPPPAPPRTASGAYPDWYAQPPRRTIPSYGRPSAAPSAPASPPLSAISPRQPAGFGIPAYMAGAYNRPATMLGSAPAVGPGRIPLVRPRHSYDVDYGSTATAPAYPGQTGPVRLARVDPDTATSAVEAIEPDVMVDPLEPMNRAIFAFNDVLDTVLFRPLAKLYSFAPAPIRNSMRRFFSNLNEPLVAVNDTLQLDLKDAGTAVGRFAVNSTIGVLGLFDPATSFGLEAHHADFGQTLHSYGVGPGPYIVLPILGPSNLRDTVGRVGDVFLDPLTYALWNEEEIRLALIGGGLLVKREELLDPLDELKSSSVDYYAATRGAYYQNRALQLAKGRADAGNKSLDRLFDELE